MQAGKNIRVIPGTPLTRVDIKSKDPKILSINCLFYHIFNWHLMPAQAIIFRKYSMRTNGSKSHFHLIPSFPWPEPYLNSSQQSKTLVTSLLRILIRIRRTGNPSRPPFSKGRRAFLNAFYKNFPFFPFEKGGKGGFDGFSKG